MTSKQEVAKWIAGVLLTLATAALFFAIAYGIYDSTRARQSTERVAEERAVASQRRIDSLLRTIDAKDAQISELKYQIGRAETACPEIKNN